MAAPHETCARNPQRTGVRLPHILIAALALGTLLIPRAVRAQAFPMSNATVNTCVGAFLDSGGDRLLGVPPV